MSDTNDRDADGTPTAVALAHKALADHGCDCNHPEGEYGTCFTCVCGRALWEEQAQLFAMERRLLEAEERRDDALAAYARVLAEKRAVEHVAERFGWDGQTALDVWVIVQARMAREERTTVEWIETAARGLGYDAEDGEGDGALPDWFARICRERDEYREREAATEQALRAGDVSPDENRWLRECNQEHLAVLRAYEVLMDEHGYQNDMPPLDWLRGRLERLRSHERTLSEALNSGDGGYQP